MSKNSENNLGGATSLQIETQHITGVTQMPFHRSRRSILIHGAGSFVRCGHFWDKNIVQKYQLKSSENGAIFGLGGVTPNSTSQNQSRAFP